MIIRVMIRLPRGMKRGVNHRHLRSIMRMKKMRNSKGSDMKRRRRRCKMKMRKRKRVFNLTKIARRMSKRLSRRGLTALKIMRILQISTNKKQAI